MSPAAIYRTEALEAYRRADEAVEAAPRPSGSGGWLALTVLLAAASAVFAVTVPVPDTVRVVLVAAGPDRVAAIAPPQARRPGTGTEATLQCADGERRAIVRQALLARSQRDAATLVPQAQSPAFPALVIVLSVRSPSASRLPPPDGVRRGCTAVFHGTTLARTLLNLGR